MWWIKYMYTWKTKSQLVDKGAVDQFFVMHGIRKARCKECDGSAFCTHGIRKEYL